MKYIYVIFIFCLFFQVSFAQLGEVVAMSAKPVMRGQAAKKPENDDMMMPKAVKMQTLAGTFLVDAWKEKGVKFRNDWDEPMVYTFQASINDDWGYGEASFTGPAGREENYYALPYGKYVGALVALKTSGRYKVMDASGVMKFTLQPGETVYFLMNDRKGTYNDNSGTLYVRWACESKYQVQMDRLVQKEIEAEIVAEIQSQVAPEVSPALDIELIDEAGLLIPNPSPAAPAPKAKPIKTETSTLAFSSVKPNPKAKATAPTKTAPSANVKPVEKTTKSTEAVLPAAVSPAPQPKVKTVCE